MSGWWWAAALAAPTIRDAEDPPPADAPSLVLLYAGEQHGRIGPCGCEGWPRGGLPALAGAAAAARAEGRPTLLLNAGGWLDGTAQFGALTDSAITANARFHRALYELRFDALNAAYSEVPSVAQGPHPGVVSATHRAEDLPIARYKRFDVGGLDVVVTGVSWDGLPYLQPAGTEIVPPVDAVRAVADLVDADVLVVLAYEVPQLVPAIAAVPGVDVVIDAADHAERWPAEVVGDAVWVRSTADGKAMGALRLWVRDGRVVEAEDRLVPLGPDIPTDPRLAELAAGR